MKNHQQARKIAEQIIFGNKTKITFLEKELLEKSPFSNVLEEIEKSNFLKLVESELNKVGENNKPTKTNYKQPIKHINKIYTGADKKELHTFIDKMEIHFKLGVPYNYGSIKEEDFKKFVEEYVQKEHLSDHSKEILTKLNNRSEYPEEFMSDLRLEIGDSY